MAFFHCKKKLYASIQRQQIVVEEFRNQFHREKWSVMDEPSTSKNTVTTNLLQNAETKIPKRNKVPTSGEQFFKFTPHVKRKKRAHHLPGLPFPSCKSVEESFTGIFTGISVEVCDYDEMHKIYENGCFGKGSQSRSAPKVLKPSEINVVSVMETLALDLEESFLLANYLKVLRISDLNGIEMQWQQQLQAFKLLKPNFIDCFVGYIYLKSKNWIVKSGIKFGGDFLIYKTSLRQYHASFIVFISNSSAANTNLRSKDVKGIQRIAETSDKDVLLLEVTKPADFEVNTLDDFKLCQISETIIRRFNYNAFVQSCNK